jgi:hypothetical protein
MRTSLSYYPVAYQTLVAINQTIQNRRLSLRIPPQLVGKLGINDDRPVAARDRPHLQNRTDSWEKTRIALFHFTSIFARADPFTAMFRRL